MRCIFLLQASIAALLLSACTLPLPPAPTVDRDSNVVLSEEQEAACGRETKEERAYEELYCCAQQGDVHAQARLGEMYLNGEGGVAKDLKEAVYWFSKAADSGLSYAEVQMGHFYRDGLGVERNIHKAICWYETAAHQGDITAMLALGDLYSKGWYSVSANKEKAYHWYYCAASLGSFEAEYRIACLLVKGFKGPCGSTKGLEILTKAADEGNPEALKELGDLYAEGRLVHKDLKRSREYYRAAVNYGSKEAAFKLGMIYEAGEGVPKDREKAASWFI